jgi:MFS transporter, DHA1 family, multidrug resistance protein
MVAVPAPTPRLSKAGIRFHNMMSAKLSVLTPKPIGLKPAVRDSASRKFPSFIEFVGLIASLMAISSLSIDNLLPAFEPMTKSLHIAPENRVQLVLYAYMIAMAGMMIVYGPIADYIGRRPTVLGGLTIYFIGSLLATFAPSFGVLLAARAIQGIGAASTRVISLAIVRDRFAGREMARVMSFTMMIFIMVPMVAPAIGSLFLHLGSWHTIFASMLGSSLLVIVWFTLRMPETLHPQFRRPITFAAIHRGFKETVTTRVSIGYSTAQGLMFGCVMGYVGSADQIFESDVYHLGRMFPAVFASVVVGQGIAAFINSRLVRRLGTRRISHSSICGFIFVAVSQLVVASLQHGHPPLWAFASMLTLSFLLFGLTVPNFNAMAMEPLGAIAGTASAFVGFYTTLVGAGLGLLVGQNFNGTVYPLLIGFLAFSGASLVIVLWTERGQLFVPRHSDPPHVAQRAHAHLQSAPSAD